MHAALVGAGLRNEVFDTLTKLTTGQSKQGDNQDFLHIEKLCCWPEWRPQVVFVDNLVADTSTSKGRHQAKRRAAAATPVITS